jgi:hypothetical protein
LGRQHSESLLVHLLRWCRHVRAWFALPDPERELIYINILQQTADRDELFYDPFDVVACNTTLTYLYRDGNNCKREGSFVVQGHMYFSQILPYLEKDDGKHWFIPGQIGLPEPQLAFFGLGFPFPTEADHPYCSMDISDVRWTDTPPTEPALTCEELIARFAATQGKWDDKAAYARWEQLVRSHQAWAANAGTPTNDTSG